MTRIPGFQGGRGLAQRSMEVAAGVGPGHRGTLERERSRYVIDARTPCASSTLQRSGQPRPDPCRNTSVERGKTRPRDHHESSAPICDRLAESLLQTPSRISVQWGHSNQCHSRAPPPDFVLGTHCRERAMEPLGHAARGGASVRRRSTPLKEFERRLRSELSHLGLPRGPPGRGMSRAPWLVIAATLRHDRSCSYRCGTGFAAGQSVSPTRFNVISKIRTGLASAASMSPTSYHVPSFTVAT